MKADHEGFLYPQVDAASCIACGICEKVCPILTPLTAKTDGSHVRSYAAYHKDEKIRLASSSGGVFTALATQVIRNGGVVFGAMLSDDMKVVHSFTETVEGLAAFRGSKYLQSRIGDAFSQVKAFLSENRLVYFSGTPCQIDGLLAYLKKPYDNLITQDIICHGVPSPLIFEKYLAYQQKKAGQEAKNISFRDKKLGWKRFSMNVTFQTGEEYRSTLTDDPFLRAFLSDNCLRPSCYNCHFKNYARSADLTLADYWGVNRIMPELDDDKGISLVFSHSEKGDLLLRSAEDSLYLTPTDAEEALRFNASMIRSVNKPKTRDKFMNEVTHDNFPMKVDQLCRVSTIKRILNKIRSILRRIFK